MLSIQALLEIHSGDSATPIKQSVNTITLNEKCPMTPTALTPQNLKMFTSTRKAALITASSGWICGACRTNQATHMCSSIVARPVDSCLVVTEKCYLTCGRGRCVDAARSLRNMDSKSATTGMGFRLAFRCANELMADSRVVDSRDEVLGCEREE